MTINSCGVHDLETYIRRMRRFIDEVAVYPVSCQPLCGGRTDLQWLDGVLAGGAKVVQLRDKVSSDPELLEKARYFRRKTKEAGALFIMNDRVDIALLADADGIHVGQSDLPPDEIRRVAPDLIIGQSCNCEDDVRRLGHGVQQGTCTVSYYNVGPIYATKTKAGLQSFLGPEAIAAFSRHCPLPNTVMGGIKFHHIDELLQAGARRIAVVTAISQAPDIGAETARWQRKIMTGRKAGEQTGRG